MHLRLGQTARYNALDKHRGIAAVAADFLLNLIAYNLIRIPNLSRRSQRPIEGTKARSIAKTIDLT
jgi:hypothetical protein